MRLSLKYLGLLLLLTGCGTNTALKRDLAGKNAPAAMTDPKLDPIWNDNHRQFRAFEPDFSPDTHGVLSAASLAAQYPVHESDGTQVAILPNGASRFGVRIQMIDQAKVSIRLQALILTADEAGLAFADHLVAAVKRGVKVTIVVDPVVNFTFKDHRLFFYLRQNNIPVFGYELFYANFIASLSQGNPFGVTMMKANMRYHEKYLITDAEVPSVAMGLLGGANFANEYFDVDQEHPDEMWRDQDIVVRGAIIQEMTRAYDTTVQEFIQEKQENGIADIDGIFNTINAVISPVEPGLARNPLIVSRLNAAAAANYPLNWQAGSTRLLRSRPQFHEDIIAPTYIDFINRAHTSIDIVNAYFIPDADIVAALNRAVLRGVKVRIVTNSVESEEFVGLGHASRATYQSVMAPGQTGPGLVSIYEWGGHKLLHNGEGHMHAKFAIFDGKASIIGSYNLDPRSRYLDTEVIVAIENPIIAAELTDILHLYIQPTYSNIISWQTALVFADANGPNASFSQQLWKILTPYL